MDKTIQEFFLAFDNGQRQFENWNFHEDESVAGKDLTGVEFKNCFLFLDFKNTNLTNSKFISCNIKTADFREANLTNGLIKNCLVESTMFKGAKVENFRFEENYCFGATVGLNDFDKMFKNHP
ncbi:pentapeptide repeat-containing protein [Dokdonia sp.]|uniref:pentapeptide repeat-containing protein n=1 Tax=Dokdonia sp. TaxID=2024995 RepID=UPI00326645B6